MSSDKTKKKWAKGDKPSPIESEKTNKLILPDPDTVLAVIPFVSPKGTKFQIIKTNQRDQYEDKPPKKKRGKKHSSSEN